MVGKIKPQWRTRFVEFCPVWLVWGTAAMQYIFPKERAYFLFLIFGYMLYAFVDLLASVRRHRRIEKRWKREHYVIQKIFEAQRDDAYKYHVAHAIDKSGWN